MDREHLNKSTRNSKYRSNNSSSRGSYRPRRKYKNTFNYPMIAAAAAAVILILIIIIRGSKCYYGSTKA